MINLWLNKILMLVAHKLKTEMKGFLKEVGYGA